MEGLKVMQLLAMTGLSHPTVRSTIDLFAAGVWTNVRHTHRGRIKGNGRVLSAAQEDAIQHMIIDKRPEQLKMDFSLWSPAAVGQLIEQECGIKLQVRSIGKYLANADQTRLRTKPCRCAGLARRGIPLHRAAS